MPATLTIRLTKKEQRILSERAKRSAMKEGAFVRKLIRGEEITTGADAVTWAERHAGDARLRVKRR